MAKKPFSEFGEGAIKIRTPKNRMGNAPVLLPGRKKKTGGFFSGGAGTARRVAKRVPEVMVKVSGAVRGRRHMQQHVSYITRNGKLLAYTDQNDLIEGQRAVLWLADSWADSGESYGDRRYGAKDTVNFVFSMSKGTDRAKNEEAVHAAARELFWGRFQYVMVRHDDTDHPHVHVTVLARGKDGRRLYPNKDDLQRFRGVYAKELRERGIEAEATPRRVRGVVQKAKPIEQVKMESRGVSDREAKLRAEVLRILEGKEVSQRPWEGAIHASQADIRKGWLGIASAVEKGGGFELAAQIKQFVSEMKPPKTRREAMIYEIQQGAVVASKGQQSVPSAAQEPKDRGRDDLER
jgi:type IV secretion system T-DNA border endonuclease VirD2